VKMRFSKRRVPLKNKSSEIIDIYCLPQWAVKI
jgi:hypothetical protein